MIIKNISGSTQTIDIGTSVQTVLNNGLIAMEPGYRWQINGIYGSKFRVATAAEVGSAGTGIMSINADATSAQVIAAGTGISVATVAGTTTITNTVTDTGITQLTGDVTAGPGNGSQAATIANLAVTNAKVAAAAAIDYSKLAALTSGNILVGSAGNVATSVAMSGDVGISNTGVTTVDTLALESITLTNIADTEILIGTGAGTAAFAALSGNATMSNAGVVTVTGATGAFEAGGAITNAGGTLAVGFIPTAVTSPQALSAPGAANITTYQTQYTSTGTGDVVTLADATRIGHLKKISYVAEGAGGDTCVITPANLAGGTTVTLAAIGDYAAFMWNGADWFLIEGIGATLA